MTEKAAFFDLDGTLTRSNVWYHLMEYFKQHKAKRITNFVFSCLHYPHYFLRRLGLVTETSFRSSWADHLAWYFRGYSSENANPIWDWVVSNMTANQDWRDDMLEVLHTHQKKGDVVLLVSSGPEPLIQKIGLSLGIVHGIGTRLEVKRGIFTGQSIKPICIDKHKAGLAKRYLNLMKIDVDFGESFAYADSITDCGLFELVGHPTAVYPDDELKSMANKRGWSIIQSP